MRILHVSMGNPKQHTGGLNRYCREVMAEEVDLGHDVLLLYPGRNTPWKKQRIIQITKSEYAIQNPLPVAITYGIDEPTRYMSSGSKKCYSKWLETVRPDVIHVHSIQGIHLEFFQAAKEQGIKVVFTTHDYYPICYYCSLLKRDGTLCEGRNPAMCAVCNQGAGLSKEKQFVLQSALYQKVKGSKLIRLVRKNVVSNAATATHKQACVSKVTPEIVDAFARLGEYYDKILNCIDIIHANSPRTGEVYRKAKRNLNIFTIPITHGNLKRTQHPYDRNHTIRFGYMGGMGVYKGYFQFLAALDLLDKREITNWEAYFYGGEYTPREQDCKDSRKHFYGYFTAAQEQKIWDNIDVLLVPSMCGETFGFVVLEALCKGVPVICSDLVGSKFLVESIDPDLVVKHSSVEQFAQKMNWLMNQNNYDETIKRIERTAFPIDMEEHVNQILALFK